MPETRSQRVTLPQTEVFPTDQRAHVVLVKPGYADMMLDGRKTIEIRVSRYRIAPFRQVSPGDTLYIRGTGAGYMATASVAWVVFHEGLGAEQIADLKNTHNHGVQADARFWRDRRHACFATVIGLADVHPTSDGPDDADVRTPGARHAWYVLHPAVAKTYCKGRHAAA
jgi:ASC-1-like (ASCH) protein